MKNQKYIPVYISCGIIFFYVCFCISFNTIRLLNPANRTGFFGIGLPAPMERFSIKDGGISLLKPTSWVGFETQQGNHGDKEVIAIISVPGRSVPLMILYEKTGLTENIKDAIVWSMQRIRNRGGYNFSHTLQDFSSARYDMKLIPYSIRTQRIFAFTKPDRIDCKDYIIYKDNSGYLISFCANERDWPTVGPYFDEMIYSLIIQ
jgi:hypothetical protein